MRLGKVAPVTPSEGFAVPWTPPSKDRKAPATKRAEGLARGLERPFRTFARALPKYPIYHGRGAGRPWRMGSGEGRAFLRVTRATLAILVAFTVAAQAGDAGRGRVIVADRARGLCLLCHQAPIAEERFQGNLAPDLAGVGGRLGEAELRQRMVDSRALNPETIMPSYGRAEGLHRVAPALAGRTILSPGEIEDVVAWLLTLR